MYHRDYKIVENVYGKLIVTSGDEYEYEYIGIIFKYLGKDKTVEVCINYHLEEALLDFDGNSSKKIKTPAGVHVFEVSDECSKLNKKEMEMFHSIAARFLSL